MIIEKESTKLIFIGRYPELRYKRVKVKFVHSYTVIQMYE